MRISSVQISNYKSFLYSSDIPFTSGFNVIVGQNNAGKTALIEAISLKFGDNPHRSIKVLPTRNTKLNQFSEIIITFTLNRTEFLDLLAKFPATYVPITGVSDSDLVMKFHRFMEAISDQNVIICKYRHGSLFSSVLKGYDVPSEVTTSALMINVNPDSHEISLESTNYHNVNNAQQSFSVMISNILRERIYFFSAERLNIGESSINTSLELAPNASNLPGVLHFLYTSNPSRFQRYRELVTIVFPQIKQITIPPTGNASARILIWNVDPKAERDDLAVLLAESGTGIGQVLAILYIVVTSDYPRTIIIDEPQSFLHPGAIRKLFEILKQNSHHQYIITTHSPVALTTSDPQTVLMVRKEDAESTVEVLHIEETQQLRAFLTEIGARLSDVFGADNILWVEGSTEELCFPLILSKIALQPLYGTAIIGVRRTGDFEKKHAKATLEIYTSLSQGRGLLPPAIGFIFDREGRSVAEMNDLVRQSNNTVHFLSRRMYENYLLNPAAIAAVASSIEGFSDNVLTADEIVRWIDNHKWDRKNFNKLPDEQSRTEEVWNANVHGANLLESIFNEFSENRVPYDKVKYGVALTDWIINHSPDDLFEVSELIKSTISNLPTEPI